MTVKEHLRQLVDELPEGELVAAERYLEYLRDRSAIAHGRLPAVLRNAPFDDEPETNEERVGVAEAWADLAAGRVMSHDEARRRLLA